MAKGVSYITKYRRRRQKKTNYARRLDFLKSGVPRLVVRISNASTRVQVVEYSENGDLILASAISSDLKKMGWANSTSNIPSAYLTGMLCASRALSKNVKAAVLDMGQNPIVKGSRVFAAVKGALEAGIQVPVDKEMLPSEERLIGAHIKAKDIKSDLEKLKSSILKNG